MARVILIFNLSSKKKILFDALLPTSKRQEEKNQNHSTKNIYGL